MSHVNSKTGRARLLIWVAALMVCIGIQTLQAQSGSYIDGEPLPTTNEYWIPDCSKEDPNLGLPTVFRPDADLGDPGDDNNGTPVLDHNPNIGVVNGNFYYRQRPGGGFVNNRKGFDIAIDPNVTGGTAVAFEALHNVSELETSSRDAILMKDPLPDEYDLYAGRRVKVQLLDGNGDRRVQREFIEVGTPDPHTYPTIMPRITNANIDGEDGWIVTCVQIDPANGQRRLVAVAFDSNLGYICDAILTGWFDYLYEYDVVNDHEADEGIVVFYTAYNGTNQIAEVVNMAFDCTAQTTLQPANNGGASWYYYNPVISYATGDEFVMAWGRYDYTGPTTAEVYVEGYDLGSNALASNNEPNCATFRLMDLNILSEFYMEGFSYGGTASAAILARDNNGDLKTWFHDKWSSTLGTVTNISTGGANNIPFAGGIITDRSLNNRWDVVYFEYNPNAGPPATSVCKTAIVNKVTLLNNSAFQVQAGIQSTVFHPAIASHAQDRLFIAIPEKNQMYIAKCNTSGASPSTTYSTAVNVRAIQNTNAFGHAVGTDEVHIDCAMNETDDDFDVIHYANGITGFQKLYFTKNFNNLTRGESRERESHALAADLVIGNYSTTSGSLSEQFSGTGEVTGTKMQRGLHSAAFRRAEACTYEEWDVNGISSIYLASPFLQRYSVDDPVLVAQGTAQDNQFINPKVAVYYSGSDTLALVTYIKEYVSGGPTDNSSLRARTVDLTDGTLGTEQTIVTSTGRFDMENFDLIHDSLTGCFLSIYGTGYNPVSKDHAIKAARLTTGGSASWTGLGISTNNLNFLKTEVATTFCNQDGTDPGAYIAWREWQVGGGSERSIKLCYITSAQSVWSPGVIEIADDNTDRHWPTVAASEDWVMVAWSDFRSDDPNFDFRPDIYATGFDVNGNVLNGYVLDGNQINNNTTLDIAGPPSYYTWAHHPQLIANIPDDPDTLEQSCLLAFVEENDGGYTLFGNTAGGFGMRIAVCRIWAHALDNGNSRSIPQTHLQLSPSTTPVDDDEKFALFGREYQTRPRLIQLPDGDVGWPGDYNPVLCVFETYPYNDNTSGEGAHDQYEQFVMSAGASITSIDYEPRGFSTLEEANLVGRLITVKQSNGDLEALANFCISSLPNKQTLGGIHATSELGIRAYYQDYQNSDNYASDIKGTQVTSWIVNDIETLADPCPTGTTSSANISFVNLSAIDLDINHIDCFVPISNITFAWATPNPFPMGPYSFEAAAVSMDLDLGAGGCVTGFDITVPATLRYISPDIVTGNSSSYGGLYHFDKFGSGDFWRVWKSGDGAQKGAQIHSQLELTAVPNPAKNFMKVTIDGPSNQPSNLELIDQLGRRVTIMRGMIPESGSAEVRLEVREIPAGSYILRASVGNLIVSQQIAIVK